ncbi:MAG: DUF4176 domain-containing protein [Lachnospiraceae bacterium]|jgi:hypothetical protein|nr:DUF4176 domain-containing protein [Lachnospiraceae bacterium]
MFEKTLPIGSVVLLKNATKRLMILGYSRYQAGDQTKVYDYCGCTYPEGFISPDKTAVFDHEQIAQIYALGYQNDEQIAFRQRLGQVLANRK